MIGVFGRMPPQNMCLGHITSSAATYSHHDFKEAKGAALKKLAAEIEKIVESRSVGAE